MKQMLSRISDRSEKNSTLTESSSHELFLFILQEINFLETKARERKEVKKFNYQGHKLICDIINFVRLSTECRQVAREKIRE